jgi:tetratricopeptide (TPR) repeat protein
VTTGPGRRTGLLAALLGATAALAFALHAPAAGAPPLRDEAERIAALVSGSPARALGFQEHPDRSSPASNLARYALVSAGGSAAWIRTAAAALHGITAAGLLVALGTLLGRRSGAAGPPSLAAAAAGAVIFAVHPIASEAVLSYSGFSLVLATCLSVLALAWAASEDASGGPRRPLAGAALYLGALLSDASTWPVGIVLAALSRRRSGDGAGPARSWARSLAPYGAALGLFYLSWAIRLWPTVSFLEVSRTWGILEGMASQSAAFVTEIRLFLMPWGLSVDHGDFVYDGSWNLHAAAGAATLVLVLAAAGIALRRGGTGALAVGTFGAAHLHALLFPPGEPVQERRLYTAAAAAALLCGAAASRLQRVAGPRAAAAAAMVLAAPLLVVARDRVRTWHDPIALWEQAAAAAPRSPVPYVVLGGLHGAAGDLDASLRALESALARAPRSASILQAIAEVYLHKEDADRAAEEAREAIGADPSFFPAYLTAGVAAMMRNDPRRAFLMFNEALRLRPQDPSALYNMGVLLYDQQRYTTATSFLEQAARARPRDPDVLFRLGMSRLRSGDYAGAAEALRGCLAEAPGRLDARTNLATVLTQTGHHEEARLALLAVLEADPGNAKALNGLAVLATARERWEEAAPLVEQAIEADPADARLVYNLAGIYERLGRTDRAARLYEEFLDRWTGALDVAEDARARLARLRAGPPR